jgi:hypothetical protein
LADQNPSDVTKVFQIEKGQVLTMMVYENIGLWPKHLETIPLTAGWSSTTGSGAYDLNCVSGSTLSSSGHANWGVSTYTVEGASSWLSITSTLIVGILAVE